MMHQIGLQKWCTMHHQTLAMVHDAPPIGGLAPQMWCKMRHPQGKLGSRPPSSTGRARRPRHRATQRSASKKATDRGPTGHSPALGRASPLIPPSVPVAVRQFIGHHDPYSLRPAPPVPVHRALRHRFPSTAPFAAGSRPPHPPPPAPFRRGLGHQSGVAAPPAGVPPVHDHRVGSMESPECGFRTSTVGPNDWAGQTKTPMPPGWAWAFMVRRHWVSRKRWVCGGRWGRSGRMPLCGLVPPFDPPQGGSMGLPTDRQ
jgi:hypothetical protein